MGVEGVRRTRNTESDEGFCCKIRVLKPGGFGCNSSVQSWVLYWGVRIRKKDPIGQVCQVLETECQVWLFIKWYQKVSCSGRYVYDWEIRGYRT